MGSIVAGKGSDVNSIRVDEVSTGSGSDRVPIHGRSVCQPNNPVATAPGTDLIDGPSASIYGLGPSTNELNINRMRNDSALVAFGE
jgi:hypothetical protein